MGVKKKQAVKQVVLANPVKKLSASKLNLETKAHGNLQRARSGKGSDKLGRGLSALFSTTTLTEKDKLVDKGGNLLELEISKIHPNPHQPRKYFDKDALQELAASIEQVGLIQPIVVRKGEKDSYELIAGERRFRAVQLLKWSRITAFIEQRYGEKLFEKMLIENVQREDLSPFEEAIAYRTLMETKNLLQEEVAELVGKSRSHVANIMRLGKLPLVVQNLLHEGKISFGIARALITLNEKDLKPFLKKIVKEGLTVREVEKHVAWSQKSAAAQSAEPAITRHNSEHHYLLGELEEQFREKLGTKVKVSDLKKKVGKIEIEYYSYEQLETLAKKIN